MSFRIINADNTIINHQILHKRRIEKLIRTVSLTKK